MESTRPTRTSAAFRTLCAALNLPLALAACAPHQPNLSRRPPLRGYSKDAGDYRPAAPSRARLVVQAHEIRSVETSPTYAADEVRPGLAIPETQYVQVPANILLAPAQSGPYRYQSPQQYVDYRLVEKDRTVQSYALDREKLALPVTVIAAQPAREAPHPSKDRVYVKVQNGSGVETGWARVFGLRDYANQEEAKSLLRVDEGESLKWLGPQAGWVAWIPER